MLDREVESVSRGWKDVPGSATKRPDVTTELVDTVSWWSRTVGVVWSSCPEVVARLPAEQAVTRSHSRESPGSPGARFVYGGGVVLSVAGWLREVCG